MWVRECLEDLTAAEFALSVEQQSESSIFRASNGINGNGQNVTTKAIPSLHQPRKKKRAVDYEKLLSQLTKRIEDMTCEPFIGKAEEKGNIGSKDGGTGIDTYDAPVLQKDRGMGRYVYTSDERRLLIE
jgi:hypothetical protein